MRAEDLQSVLEKIIYAKSQHGKVLCFIIKVKF